MTDPTATSEGSTGMNQPLGGTVQSSAEVFAEGWLEGWLDGFACAEQELQKQEPWHGKVMLSEGKMDE